MKWLPIPEYETWYEVSEFGDVRSVDRVVYAVDPHTRELRPRHYSGKVLRPKAGKNGYLNVVLSKGGNRRCFHVHVLVARAFHGPPPGVLQWVLHRDGDARNNRADNLYYHTPTQNQLDRYRHARSRRNGGSTS